MKKGDNKIVYEHLKHIMAGLPLEGTAYLQLDKDRYFIAYRCGSPPKWSDDGTIVAIPKWVVTPEGNKQRLIIINTQDLNALMSYDTYNVLEIHKVTEEKIHFTEIGSPVLEEVKHTKNFTEIAEEDNFILEKV
ncbi:hypothetical protein GF362_06460 [Candidatus Dojkabacteria bacterium]|nr:hypothetical protein [Candidatus Dojkabacteria bacterium]